MLPWAMDAKEDELSSKKSDSRKAKEKLLTQIEQVHIPNPVLALWTLRLLVRAGGLRVYLRENSYRGSLAELLDLESDPLDNLLEEEAREVLTALLEHVEGLVGLDKRELESGTILSAARELGKLLGLTPLEEEILAFAHSSYASDGLEEALDFFRSASRARFHRALSVVFSVPQSAVTEALHPLGNLRALKLVRKASTRNKKHFIELEESVGELLNAELPATELKRTICPEAPQTELGLTDFPHLERDLGILLPYLRRALEDGTAGVNVLLHGPPGTGKTQLARVIARELGVTLHEVKDESSEGKAYDGPQRVTAYAMSQRLLSSAGGTLLTFDEIEDLFPWSRLQGWFEARSAHDKAWTNRLLETNRVPCIWIGNEVGHLDAAFLRRFSLIVEVPVPPVRVREQILRRHLAGLEVSRRWLTEQASQAHLTPADAARAATVCRTVSPAPGEATEVLLGRVIDLTLDARGELGGARTSLPGPLEHDLALLHVDCDVAALIQTLREKRRGTICLFGPPGTGKSLLVSRIAQELGVECLVKSGGDLLDMYVGGTEQKIAAMFREAEQSGALLFLDEAEGLLRDRAEAQQSWEATRVNELLVRMERFRGIFFCATNLLMNVDRAALRRFSLKIRFLPSTLEQRVILTERTLRVLSVPQAGDERHLLQASLERLGDLTPGDFTAVLRGAELTNTPWTVGRLLSALESECELKKLGEPQRVVGFGRRRGE